MLLQGIEGIDGSAIHDTVAALLRDRAYHRSIWSSIIGRIVVAVLRLMSKLFEALRGIPGGRTTVIVAVGLVVLIVAGRILLTGQWRDDGVLRRRARGGQRTGRDPWAEAHALAASGDYMGAAHSLYRAVLRSLSGAERIRLHSSKTTGDYYRELRRRQSALADPFRQFGRRFDRVVFGAGECSQEEFAAMLREATVVAEGTRQ